MFEQNQTIILRNIAKSDGSVTTAIPAIVISDDERLLATFIPKGTPFKNNWVIPADQRVALVDGIIPSAERRYKDLSWWNDTIRLYLPGYGYSVWLNFDEGGTVTSWYGNLEAPFVRTPIGIDTRDFALDIVGQLDRSWAWKDKDEFERRLEVGVDSAKHQAKVMTAGKEFIRRFEQNEWPFDQGWESWRLEHNYGEWAPRSLFETWSDDFGSAEIFDQF